MKALQVTLVLGQNVGKNFIGCVPKRMSGIIGKIKQAKTYRKAAQDTQSAKVSMLVADVMVLQKRFDKSVGQLLILPTFHISDDGVLDC